jgi:hypothetical protein
MTEACVSRLGGFMRGRTLRAVVLVCLFSVATPIFSAPRQDEPGVDVFIKKIVRVVRHLLTLDTVDPTYPKP